MLLSDFDIVNNNGLITVYDTGLPLVEPLGAELTVDKAMERFPAEIYNKGRDTHLYRFLLSLLGEAGAGQIKKAALVIRSKNEGPLLVFKDLDTFYGVVLDFPRLKSEIYSFDPSSAALTREEWDEVRLKDQAYKNRIIDLFNATRFGNSPQGMGLVARAATGLNVEVWENYKYNFDQLSDLPIGIAKTGTTDANTEFIVTPQVLENINDVATSTVQLVIKNRVLATNNPPTAPSSGSFKFRYNYNNTYILSIGLGYNPTLTQVTSILRQVYSSAVIAMGISAPPSTSVHVAVNDDPTSVDPDAFAVFDLSFPAVFDQYSLEIQSAGADYTVNSHVYIKHATDDAHFISTLGSPSASYYERYLTEIANGATDLAARATAASGGAQIPLLSVQGIDQELHKYLSAATDRIKPVNTFMTVSPERSRLLTVTPRRYQASSEQFSLARFVTGNSSVAWPTPAPQNGTFIESNIENESISLAYIDRLIPVIFHTFDKVYAYAGEAALDADYGTQRFYDEKYQQYLTMHAGIYNQTVQQLFPALRDSTSADIYFPEYAVANQDTPYTISSPNFIS